MIWNKWSYVKKGAFLGAIIGIFGSIISVLAVPPIGEAIVENKILWALGLPFALIGLVFSTLGIFGCNFYVNSCSLEILAGYIVTIIIFALIGAIIGLIVGRVKSK